MPYEVLIVGAGFGGLKAAKELANKEGIQVKVIDKSNHHLFQPLLYQVASAALSPSDIAVPIRSELSHAQNIEVILANVESVDLEKKEIRVDGLEMSYDSLILACGSSHSYFGHNEWEPYAPGLKTLAHATEIRRRILLAFELAEKEKNSQKREALMSFAIVGAGPTGVELAGAISEIARVTLRKDFRNIDTLKSKVFLVEGTDRVLGSFDSSLSKSAQRDLKAMGVEVLCGKKVSTINENGIYLGSDFIPAKTVIWAAGVAPSKLSKSLKVELDRQGRVLVEKDWSLKKHPEVFVIGDMASFNHGALPLPALAPVALQSGSFVAKQILRDTQKKPRKLFQYLDKGQMATIGRKRAVMQFGTWKQTGLIAWIAWLLVHIYYLIGFKNKLFVMLNWAWSYLSFKKGARLIVDKNWRE